MRFSKQLFDSSLQKPPNMASMKTSALLSRGLVTYSLDAGLPIYSPIGIDVLERIETAFIRAALQKDFSRVGLPNIINNDDLFSGEPVGKQFLSKVIFLQPPLENFHLLTTPEMIFARMSDASLLSHRSFPIRLTYTTNIFRQIPEPRFFITSRQFRVFGCACLYVNEGDSISELENIISMCKGVFSRLGISVDDVRQESTLHSELVYKTSEGDTYFEKNDLRQRALSLAIGYQYGTGIKIPIKYRSITNRFENPFMITFALCTNRLLFCLFDAHRDELGFSLPPEFRPFDIILLPRSNSDCDLASKVAQSFSISGIRAGLDDRLARNITDRKTFADYIGAPATFVVHKGALFMNRRGERVSYSDMVEPNQALSTIKNLFESVNNHNKSQ